MSHPGRPLPVKPLISILAGEQSRGMMQVPELSRFLGPPDLISSWLPFTHSDYYTAEMGPRLARRVLSFLHLADPGALADWKARCLELERRWSWGGRRLVNLDPGYLTRERLVLATGKNYTHRLYLGQGIFGEVTLQFRNRRWAAFPWTYPDYAGEPLQVILTQVRKKYLWQLQSLQGKT